MKRSEQTKDLIIFQNLKNLKGEIALSPAERTVFEKEFALSGEKFKKSKYGN